MMKNTRNYILFLTLFSLHPVFGQQDSVNVLKEVVINAKLQDFSTGQTLLEISDSVAKRTRPMLTEVLKFNTPIYFKENGLGMVSSASFRGTTASQTAVLWNGININSQFNGQTDFNTINTAGYDNIIVRGGGGSVIYGTGAIGGTVHLNNDLSFREKLENEVFLQYGSFNSLDANYQLKVARDDLSLSISGAHSSSDNDYVYPYGGGKNINGHFFNNSFNVSLGYRLSPGNKLKFYSEIFEGERHFSLIRPSETKTKYQNFDVRNLLEWERKFSNFTSVARLAFLNESYKYYGNITSLSYSLGNAESFITEYDITYIFSKKIRISSIISNNYTRGKGSDIDDNSRNIFSAAVLMKHRMTEKFSYEIGMRKEVTSNNKSPVLYSAGADYRFSDFYRLKLNGSRNYRIPTFNDLYWFSGGNANLSPELSLQAEAGNEFIWREFELVLTAFYIDIKDMIRWVPESNGIWRPKNIEEVHTYGLETFLNWGKFLGSNKSLKLFGSYAYTISENKRTNFKLIYVPFHKATLNAQFSFKRWNAEYQFLYNGEVYTRSDNNIRYNLEDYTISNVGISYGAGNNGEYRIGARVRNFSNTAYESVENRWMPGRNYTIYLNLNF